MPTHYLLTITSESLNVMLQTPLLLHIIMLSLAMTVGGHHV